LLTVPFIFPYHGSPQDYYRYTHDGLRHLMSRAGMEAGLIEGQCASVPTVCLLFNVAVGFLIGVLASRFWLRPFAWLLRVFVIVPVNLLGVVAAGLTQRNWFTKGFPGYANYIAVGRKLRAID
jgi:hypothetical protein